MATEFDIEVTGEKLHCTIEKTKFNIDYSIEPVLVNDLRFSNAYDAWVSTCDELKACIAEWNSQAFSYTGKLMLNEVIAASAMTNVRIDFTLPTNLERMDYNFSSWRNWSVVVHQDMLNPLQTKLIILYHVLVDQGVLKYTDALLNMIRLTRNLRNITSEYVTNKKNQSFTLQWHKEHYLLDDDDCEEFTLEKQPGDIFLASPTIGYDYENLIVERSSRNNQIAVKMSSNSFDLIEQQVSYTGELLFYTGDHRVHSEIWNEMNDSLNNFWGGYKLKKTDITNPYKMLSIGLIKVGTFQYVS